MEEEMASPSGMTSEKCHGRLLSASRGGESLIRLHKAPLSTISSGPLASSTYFCFRSPSFAPSAKPSAKTGPSIAITFATGSPNNNMISVNTMGPFKHAQWSQLPLISLTEGTLTRWQFDKATLETERCHRIQSSFTITSSCTLLESNTVQCLGSLSHVPHVPLPKIEYTSQTSGVCLESYSAFHTQPGKITHHPT